MEAGKLIVPKVWRSEIARLILFFITGASCIFWSRLNPHTVITGELFSLADKQVMLKLPLLWFIPALALGSAILRIYDVRYTLDEQGIEARTGIISLYQRITRIRFEDIRSIETEQTLLERALDIGNLEIGTAATGGIEVTFKGVAAPKQVQKLIRDERDRRQKLTKDSDRLAAIGH